MIEEPLLEAAPAAPLFPPAPIAPREVTPRKRSVKKAAKAGSPPAPADVAVPAPAPLPAPPPPIEPASSVEHPSVEREPAGVANSESSDKGEAKPRAKKTSAKATKKSAKKAAVSDGATAELPVESMPAPERALAPELNLLPQEPSAPPEPPPPAPALPAEAPPKPVRQRTTTQKGASKTAAANPVAVEAAPVVAPTEEPRAEPATVAPVAETVSAATPAPNPTLQHPAPMRAGDHSNRAPQQTGPSAHRRGGPQEAAPATQDPQQGEGRFRNKWDKRNKFRGRERQRDGQNGSQSDGRDGDAQQPREAPPERPLGPPEPSEGILELTPKGYGFLRQKSRQWAEFNQDPWVSPEWIRNLGLRTGMWIKGVQREGHRGPQVTEITEVNGLPPDKIRNLPLFEELKAVNPCKRIQLETVSSRLTTRVIDLFTPVGRGQRGLIVAPPRAGKTTLLEHIAEALTQNHPQMHLMVLLVDERPEEVTEFRRALPNAEIHASSNDSDIKTHMRTAVLAIERAKRLVECGQHVFILLDSITRMARAFNNAQKGGATATGGLGVGALEMPRRLFAAARNTREAGSLTILATTLIETNSKMDEAIFQEFKGTGNLELVLDRKIAEQYIYPAVNIFRSGTRREELLLPPFQLEKIHMLRRGLAGHKPMEAIQRVITLMERAPSNSQMLVELPGKSER
ncbi:MAG: transcription termination factor Rho [Roseimicrobium sp.]